MLLGAEQAHPFFTQNKTIHFGKLVLAFEAGVLPAITLDLGGAEEITNPLVLYDDHVLDKVRREKKERAAAGGGKKKKNKEEAKLGEVKKEMR